MTSAGARGEVRWGILATGGIASLFTKDLLAHGHRVAAVGSRSPESAQRFAAEHGIVSAYGSYEELVAAPDVDVVYVATPHNLHAANAVMALEHGKHVLVEKAFTVTEAQAQRIADAGASAGLAVMEAMWTRFLPHMGFVRSAIADGRLGRVRSLHADHTQSLPREDSHRLNNPRLAGGALLDLGVYPVSFAHDILGEPLAVSATATFTRTGVDSSVATVFRHDDGAVSTSFSSMETRGPNRATVLGTDGRLELEGTWYAPTRVTLYDAHERVVEVYHESVSGRGMQYQAAEMERLLATGERESEILTPAASVAVMRTLDAVRSAIGLDYPLEVAAV